MSRNYPPRDSAGQPIHDYKEIRLEFAQMKLDARKRKERKENSCNGGCCDNGTGYCMFCERKLQ